MKAIFVTGTDTGVGKTVVTGCLAKYLSEKGLNVVTQKWVQTGCAGKIPSDIRTHLKIAGKSRGDIKPYIDLIAPYVLKTSCSPHLAAKIENRKIDKAKIIKSFNFLCKQFDMVIVEGAGGALVPINKKDLLIDIAKELSLPVLIVAENKLGAINHALLTIEALKSRKMKILGVIFNNCKKEDSMISEDNPKIIKELSGVKILGVLPYCKSIGRVYKYFMPVAEIICSRA